MRIKYIFLLITAVILTGCSPIALDIDDLMQPPSLSDEQAKIMEALKTSLSTDQIQLKYPRFGNYRSAFVLHDLDADGKNEALVFYEQSIGSTNIARINILDNENDEWRSIYDMPGLGTDVEFVEFAHMINDKKFDILIGWTIGSNAAKTTLTAYSYDDAKLNKLIDYDYSIYKLIDRKDGMQELIVLSDSLNDPTAKIIKKRTSKKLGVSSTVKLSREAKSYHSAKLGKIDETSSALFIDEILFDDSIATEVLMLDEPVLRNLMINTDLTKNELFLSTIRPELISCEDINNDGVLEIPFQKLLQGYGDEDELENLYLTTYNSLVDNQLLKKQDAILNQKDGYKIIMPQNWVNNVTVKVQQHNGEYSFVVFKNSLSESTSEILRIRVYSKDDYRDKFELEQFKNIAIKGAFEYYAYIPEDVDEKYKITYDDLKSMFVLL
ncbi:MAG: hypothetical protein RR710_01710 [Oscillospiraceae bacterium]